MHLRSSVASVVFLYMKGGAILVKQQINIKQFVAGYTMLNVVMGKQVKPPKFSNCRLCNKYPRLVLVELGLCCDCADAFGKALRALFGFVTQQEKARG